MCTHKQENIFFPFTVEYKPQKLEVCMNQGLSKNKSQWRHTSVLCLKYLRFVRGYNSNYWVIKFIFFLQWFYLFWCFISPFEKLWVHCKWKDKFQCTLVGCRGADQTFHSHYIQVYHRGKKKTSCIMVLCHMAYSKPLNPYLGTNSQAGK